jgi:hypothetical protein
LAGIELFHEPRSCLLCDFPCRYDEDVIEQNLSVRVEVEDRMIDRHPRLTQGCVPNLVEIARVA